jgi:hypothetical protein
MLWLKDENDVKPAILSLVPAKRKGCEPSSVPTPDGVGTLEHPYLDRLPEKKEAHFSGIVDFSVGRGDAIGYARDFLDRGRRRSPQRVQDVFSLLHAIGVRKGEKLRIAEIGVLL